MFFFILLNLLIWIFCMFILVNLAKSFQSFQRTLCFPDFFLTFRYLSSELLPFPPALSRALSLLFPLAFRSITKLVLWLFSFFFKQVLSTVNMSSLCLTDFGMLRLHFHSLKRIFKYPSSIPSPSSCAVMSCLDSMMLCTFCRLYCCYILFSSFVELSKIKHSILNFLYLLRFILCPNIFSNLEKILGAS